MDTTPPLRSQMSALLARIGLWPLWLKVGAAVAAVALVLAAGFATPLLLRPRATAATHPPAASPSPTTAPASPSPSAGAAPLASTLRCKLAVSSGGPGSGGFIVFPAGSFSPDPASNVTTDAGGYGAGAMSFDHAAGKWVPAPRSLVLPDGSRYAYWDFQTQTMRLESIATRADTVIGPRQNGAASAARLNGAQGWLPIEATSDGVYAIPQGPTGGLWVFPVSGAGERQVTASGFWHAIGGGAGWGTLTPSAPQGATTTIIRLDLASRATSDWFSRPGLQSHVEGFDTSCHAVVSETSADVTEIWLVTAQNNGTKLIALTPPANGGQQGGPPRALVTSVIGDANGIWIETNRGLYLSAGGRTEQVSAISGILGGGCV
jgi:hypothetical protein